MGSEIGIGIVGYGGFGTQHGLAIAAVDGVNLTAVCRTDRAVLAQAATQLGVHGYADYRRLIEDSQVAAICVATPHHLHTPVVLAAAAAGKPVLLEKPMAPTLEECDQMNTACDSAGVVLMLAHVNHYYRPYAMAKPLIQSGELGDYVSGSAVQVKQWGFAKRAPWHLDRALGGGMWLTGGVHCIDRLTWLVGRPIVRVSARFQAAFHDQHADDFGLAMLYYEGGATGLISSIGYAQGVPDHHSTLTFTGGQLRLERIEGAFIGRGERWERIPDSSTQEFRQDGLRAQWRDFRDAVRGEIANPVTGDFARHIMAACFAAEESSRRDQDVEVAAPQVTSW